MDVHDSGSGFENSGRVSAGPASLNYSVDLCHRNGYLQFSGWSEHNSQALLQAGFPGEAHISAALQTEGKAARHCSWPAGRSPRWGGGLPSSRRPSVTLGSRTNQDTLALGA